MRHYNMTRGEIMDAQRVSGQVECLNRPDAQKLNGCYYRVLDRTPIVRVQFLREDQRAIVGVFGGSYVSKIRYRS